MQENFGKYLKRVRSSYRDESHNDKGLTLRELGKRSGISFSRIGDLENGRRCASEATLKRLAEALALDDADASDFLLRGLRATGTQTLPSDFERIPPEVYQMLMTEILAASRKKRLSKVSRFERHPECDLMWETDDGVWFAVEVMTVFGSSRHDAILKLRRKIRAKAGIKNEGKKTS